MSHSPFMPEGEHDAFERTSAQEAVVWLTLLMSEEATEQDRLSWQAWRAATAENDAAWRHIESVCARFSQLNAQAAHQSLSTAHHGRTHALSRRSLLKALGVISLTGTGLAAGSRTALWQSYRSDYATRIGEQRQVTLADGTQLLLNTQSAVNIAYDDSLRHVQLVRGDVLIETGQAEKQQPFPRPFIVQTAQGTVQALGTRFSLSSADDRIRVAVFDGKVRLCPQQAKTQEILVAAGHGTWFSPVACGRIVAVAREPAWVKGQLLADNQRLADFLDELTRYRQGVIRYAPEIANLRFSGVFPLQQGDQILSALQALLPIRIRYFSRYWVEISARA